MNLAGQIGASAFVVLAFCGALNSFLPHESRVRCVLPYIAWASGATVALAFIGAIWTHA